MTPVKFDKKGALTGGIVGALAGALAGVSNIPFIARIILAILIGSALAVLLNSFCKQAK